MIEEKIAFIENYKNNSQNAASASKFDANANVATKNIATMEYELPKDMLIGVNRTLVSRKIEELYGKDLSNEYIRQIKDHEIYVHDETSLKPYCVSINMYPFLQDGLTKLGGESKAPKHLASFCGSFINLIFAVAAQFAGAVATVEFLMYFDYFAKKSFGDNYLDDHSDTIKAFFESVVYSINQPAAARGYQSVFWNITIYDEEYFNGMFGDFVFPDDHFTKPEWKSINNLQKTFMKWLNKERERSLLTFPVVTAAMLVDKKKGAVDLEFADFCAEELALGNSFFIYQSDSVDSLASCCRLRNEISDNEFSYSLGAGGVATGSINVITMNMNRLIQKNIDVGEQVDKIHKYQIAYRAIMDEFKEANLLPVYDAGFITLDKQYLTIGINGLVEAAEFKGFTAGDNEEYKNFCTETLKVIYDRNKAKRAETGYMFNTEFVPAENLGVKNAAWDKKDGLVVNRDCYNSYFYAVEDSNCDVSDKFIVHGEQVTKYLDGGSALHLNLDDYLTKDQYLRLFNYSAKEGCNYFCINVKVTVCNDCGHIHKKTLSKCVCCKSENISHATRVIGYLKKVDSFSKPRQDEHNIRLYHDDSTTNINSDVAA